MHVTTRTAQSPPTASGSLRERPAFARLLVAVQLAILVLLAAVTVFRFHVWADIDERPHYDYIQKVVEDQRLPRPTDLVSPEVQAITDRTWPRPSGTDPADIGIAGRSYEAIQPPLYYLVAAPSFAALGDHRQKVFAVRAFDLGLLCLAVWLLWRLARRLASREQALVAFGVALTTVLWPGVVVRAVTIGTTPLELVLGTAFLLALWCADSEHRGDLMLAAAVLLGLCLLTKLSLVCLVPLFLIALVKRVSRDRTRRRSGEAVALAAIPPIMLAPWLISNLVRYDSLTVDIMGGQGVVSPVTSSGLLSRLGALPELDARLLDGVLPQEWNVQLDVWWIRVVVDGLAILLLAGAIGLLATRRRDWQLWFLALPFVSGVLLMNVVYVLTGSDTFLLRYIYATIPPLALGVGLALGRAWPGKLPVVPIAGAASLVVAALWLDMGGAFYFTDIGDKLGI
jgi:4-amino-4-deoxy-L-arabinose transferase-like glycosyltransferase